MKDDRARLLVTNCRMTGGCIFGANHPWRPTLVLPFEILLATADSQRAAIHPLHLIRLPLPGLHNSCVRLHTSEPEGASTAIIFL